MRKVRLKLKSDLYCLGNWKCDKIADLWIFNFSSPTTGHFSNVTSSSIDLLPKTSVQIFETLCSNKIIRQNVQKMFIFAVFFGSYIASILKPSESSLKPQLILAATVVCNTHSRISVWSKVMKSLHLFHFSLFFLLFIFFFLFLSLLLGLENNLKNSPHSIRLS